MARVAVSEIRFDLGVSYERYMGTWSPADAAERITYTARANAIKGRKS